MRKAVLFVIVLLATFSVGAQVLGAKHVFIESISGYDSQLVNIAPTYLSQWVRSLGHSLVSSRDSADYIIRFAIVSSTTARSFNWWFLLLPLWPFVPVTTIEADVVLFMAIQTADGRGIFTNQTGGHSAAWWFADFVSGKSQKKAAFEQAFRALTVTAYLP